MVATAFDGPTGTGLLHDLKIVAVAVAVQGVGKKAKSLTPDQRARSALGPFSSSFTTGAL